MSRFVVYTHRDAQGRALYVGQSMRLAERTATHSATKSWWRDVASIDTAHAESKEEVDALERRLIAELDPLYNAVHSPRRARERAARQGERGREKRSRLRPDLVERVEALRGDAPFDRVANRMVESGLDMMERDLIARRPELRDRVNALRSASLAAGAKRSEPLT